MSMAKLWGQGWRRAGPWGLPSCCVVIEVGFSIVTVHWLGEVQACFLAAVLLNQYSAAQN